MALGWLRRSARRSRPAGAKRPRRTTLVGCTLADLWCAAAGCGPAADGTCAGARVVYVANARDGTLTRIAPATGRVLGPPMPGGAAPGALAAGPRGAVLVRTTTAGVDARLTFIAPAMDGW
jgi:hypothetical protein